MIARTRAPESLSVAVQYRRHLFSYLVISPTTDGQEVVYDYRKGVRGAMFAIDSCGRPYHLDSADETHGEEFIDWLIGEVRKCLTSF